MSDLFSPHYLPSSGSRSANRAPVVVHYVQDISSNGDNFNSAACGKKPTGKSLGWQPTSRLDVNCHKCKRLAGL